MSCRMVPREGAPERREWSTGACSNLDRRACKCCVLFGVQIHLITVERRVPEDQTAKVTVRGMVTTH